MKRLWGLCLIPKRKINSIHANSTHKNTNVTEIYQRNLMCMRLNIRHTHNDVPDLDVEAPHLPGDHVQAGGGTGPRATAPSYPRVRPVHRPMMDIIRCHHVCPGHGGVGGHHHGGLDHGLPHGHGGSVADGPVRQPPGILRLPRLPIGAHSLGLRREKNKREQKKHLARDTA